ncbi:MAG TPA: MarR family winged helix-turn-helix transcriptional regulator [Kouleothrix sp.]|nr:MarR family winged helix-turn-helix transcriptional regulator [Kouleothrix sp.]
MPPEPEPAQPSLPSALPAPLTVWLSYLLRQATLRVQDRVADALAEHGIRPPHNAVLSMLAAGPLAQIALATQLQTDRTTMVSIIDDLEVWQLVERRRNPLDRRAHDITLTELGRARLSAAQNAVSAADAVFFAALSETEREQLRAMLLRLIAAHDANRQEPT